jgi:PAS domain S-box-containing protein
MRNRNARRWAPGGIKPYAVAAAALAVASAIRFALHPILKDNLPFLTFTIAALLVEFYCGLAPALLVVAGGFLIGTYYFVPPYATFLAPEIWDLVYTVGYFAVVLLGIALIESLQRSRYEARMLREVAQSRLEMLERSHAGRRQAEAAAQRSEEQYLALASSMPHVWYMRRRDGNFEYVNDLFYELTGLAPGSLQGSGWLSVIHPDDAQAVRASWDRIAATGEECASGFRLRMADGTYRYFAGRLTCVQDKRGRIIKWEGFGSAQDSPQAANL